MITDKPVHQTLAESETATTRLARALARPLRANAPDSGIQPLAKADEAFIARMLLATVAEKSIDAQYYIWHRDITGLLFLQALSEAAERGVRIRLLVDDNGIQGLDELLVALTAHPNIHIRLFNPFIVRNPKWLGYLTDFSRLNRRMHNKAFIVDNRAAIVGGRNIGDEYFGATDGLLFSDLDVLAVGPVVDKTSRDFDRYWNHSLSYPVGRIAPATGQLASSLLADLRSGLNQQREQRYLSALENSAFLDRMLRGDLELFWSTTELVSDNPDKILKNSSRKALLSRQLNSILGEPKTSLTLVSPYFVPTEQGLDYFRALSARGVRVTIITNSLEATDVAAVHSGYAPYREPLVRAGVELYEMRKQGNQAPGFARAAGPLGSSGSSLHAKTFIVDGQQVFVGSFNFDPRSINLNTELGFVIDNTELAGVMAARIRDQLPASSYQVRLDSEGQLYWVERNAGKKTIHAADPHTPAHRRFLVWLLSLLPLESLL
ncbi:phospholipase D family protein [Marinobacter sp. VGCF2001]|uniref:phospholipase D family protein n=1 Tax=Marinobacter sp. VGCF2001 TaxID=3417189 RepID=UPI003CEDBD8D